MPDPICVHEAAHAAVARHLGLVVREVRVKGEVATPRYCETLYGIPAGTIMPGSVCLLEEDCLEEDEEGVLVAMIAPTFVETGDPKIDNYAALEAAIACMYASKHGHNPDWLLHLARASVEACVEEVGRIAILLQDERVIDGRDL